MAVVAMRRVDRRTQLREVMKCLDIDPAAGVLPQWSLSYFTVLHHCESCPSKEDCNAWLDQTAAPASVPPRFCPNADILFELQFDQLHHPPIPGSKTGADSSPLIRGAEGRVQSL